MREILFRGKRVDNGKWVYGYYVPAWFGRFRQFPCRPAIVPEPVLEINGEWEPIAIKPETVGQFTGLTDKNSRKIFEGDIVSTVDGNYLIVCDDYTGFHFEMRRELTGGYIKLESLSFYDCEVIGNIHDNPELLEVDK